MDTLQSRMMPSTLPTEANLFINGDRLIEVAFHWEPREGGEQSLRFQEGEYASMDELRQRAQELGWPGHNGGWWNYLKDDLRALWQRLTRPKGDRHQLRRG